MRKKLIFIMIYLNPSIILTKSDARSSAHASLFKIWSSFSKAIKKIKIKIWSVK
jgi:hypothetical protein